MPVFGVNPAESQDDFSETSQQENMKRENVMARARIWNFFYRCTTFDKPWALQVLNCGVQKEPKEDTKMSCVHWDMMGNLLVLLCPLETQKSRNKLCKINLILMKQLIQIQLNFSSIIEYWSHSGGRNISDCGSLSCCANFRTSSNDVPYSISKVGMSLETEQKYLLPPHAKCFEILVWKKWKMSKASSSLNSLAMVILHGHHSQEECFIWEGIITSSCQNMKSNYAVN